MTTQQLVRIPASPSNVLSFLLPERHPEALDDSELATQENRLREALAKVRTLRRQRDDAMRPPSQDVVKALYAARESAASCVAMLTPREHEILELILAGRPNKIIAWELDISQRTVENHRASIMHKTGAKSVPALTRLAIAAAWSGGDGSDIQPAARAASPAERPGSGDARSRAGWRRG